MGGAYELAKGIAINAFLKNSLQEINLKQGFMANYGLLEGHFIPYMNLSEKEIAEYWENFEEAKVMEKE